MTALCGKLNEREKRFDIAINGFLRRLIYLAKEIAYLKRKKYKTKGKIKNKDSHIKVI